MMGNFFDDLSRGVGNGMPRRDVLRLLLSSLAAWVASAFFPRIAKAACPPGAVTCGPLCCTAPAEQCCARPDHNVWVCCPVTHSCCTFLRPGGNPETICCPPGTI